MQSLAAALVCILLMLLVAVALLSSGRIPVIPQNDGPIGYFPPPDPALPLSAKPQPEPASTLSGTPDGVPLRLDCALRQEAYGFGTKLLSAPLASRAHLLYDALQLWKCPKKFTMTQPASGRPDWAPPSTPIPDVQASTLIIYVDAKNGKDSTYAGSRTDPLRTVQEALRRANKATTSQVTVVLREGVYTVHSNSPLLITRSFVTLRNEPGERATISGAEFFKFKLSAWTRVSKDRKTDSSVWSVALPQHFLGQISGLRLDNQRLVRAKSPNGAPEQSGASYAHASDMLGQNGYYVRGWYSSKAEDWLPPVESADQPKMYESGPQDWPFAQWPDGTRSSASALDPFSPMAGTGGRGPFRMGSCRGGGLGYFCSKDVARGDAYRFRAPRGMRGRTAEGQLPPPNSLVVAWRGGSSGLTVLPNATSRWFTWTFSVSPASSPSHAAFGNGGFQGAQGADYAAEWYAENALEFLDEPGEFFHDVKAERLYVVFNGSSAGPTGKEAWGVIRDARELLRVEGLSALQPASSVTLSGLEFRDAAASWLDAHEQPSGGDWALPRAAAVRATNVLKLSVVQCLFERVDGHALLVEGFARQVAVQRNEFAWIGASAVVLWGRTAPCLDSLCLRRLPGDGPDGRSGEQPRYTVIQGNLFREVGVFVKQSSAVFQALAGLSKIRGNVMFNGPRALVCFSDGFLGGDALQGNLLFNAVRESGDHGPVNFWDRVPYLHDLGQAGGGFGSTRTLDRVVDKNFVLATYASQAPLDTDDGASHIVSRDNVFVYGYLGLKSDFGGHDLISTDDLRLLVGGFCFMPGPLLAKGDLNLNFVNSTCVLRDSAGESGYPSACSHDASILRPVNVFGNKIFSSTRLKVCGGKPLERVLRENPRWDPRTTVGDMPPLKDLLGMVRDKVQRWGVA